MRVEEWRVQGIVCEVQGVDWGERGVGCKLWDAGC